MAKIIIRMIIFLLDYKIIQISFQIMTFLLDTEIADIVRLILMEYLNKIRFSLKTKC